MSPLALLAWIVLALVILWFLKRALGRKDELPYGAFPARPAGAEPPADAEASPESLMAAGRTLEAIKALRARHPGLGLKEAKDMADHFAAHGRWPEGHAVHPAPPPAPGADLESLIRSGDMIEAIKRYREQHPEAGLKEARDAVIALSQRLQS